MTSFPPFLPQVLCTVHAALCFTFLTYCALENVPIQYIKGFLIPLQLLWVPLYGGSHMEGTCRLVPVFSSFQQRCRGKSCTDIFPTGVNISTNTVNVAKWTQRAAFPGT